MRSIVNQMQLLYALTATSLALLASCSGQSGSLEYPVPPANCSTGSTQTAAGVQSFALGESKTLGEIQNGTAGGTPTGTATGTPTGTATGTPTGTATGAPNTGATAAPQSITFYKDLFPILQSSSDQYPFKCLTCHITYGTPESMSNVPELTRIVDSMRTGRMPRSPIKVPEGYIKLFELWRAAGFPPGDPNTKSTTLPTLTASSNATPQGASAIGCSPTATTPTGSTGGW